MEKKKRILILIAVMGVVILGLGVTAYYGLSLFRTWNVSNLEKLTIADGSIVNSAPVYVALGKGYFKREGLDVALQSFPSGKIALDHVIQGSATLATVSDVPIMFEAMKSNRITVLATISSTSTGYAIAMKRGSHVLTPSDLKGKIGIAKGTAGEFFLDTFLAFHRIPKNQIQRVHVDIDKMFDALNKGEVDAVSTWDPYTERFKKEMDVIFFYGEELYKMTWNIAALKDFTEKKPDTVRKGLRALLEAEAFISKNPEESKRITAGYLKISEDALAGSWDLQRFRVNLGMSLLLNLEDEARWAIETRITDKTKVPNFLNLIYVKGLKSLKPEAVSIVQP